MEDVIKIMKLQIKKDACLLEKAEMLKKVAKVSSIKAWTFVFSIGRILPKNISGHCRGEFWYIYYKDNLFMTIDSTKTCKDNRKRNKNYTAWGRLVITLNTQTEFQKFIDYIVKEEDVTGYNMFKNWINKDVSLYRQDKWRK